MRRFYNVAMSRRFAITQKKEMSAITIDALVVVVVVDN